MFLGMSKKREILSWEEITSIINAEESELEDNEEFDESDDEIQEEMQTDIEIIQEKVKYHTQLIDTIMEHEQSEDEIELEVEVEENIPDQIYNQLDEEFIDIEEGEIDLNEETPAFNITARNDIQWRKQNYIPEPCFFHHTAPEVVNRTPYEIFSKYITKALIIEMSTFTNIYALQKGATFKHADPEEILKLIGVHILMGIMKFPQLRMYWNSALKVNSISSCMTRDRFFQLRTNLHLIDNNTIPSNCEDKLIKVRPIIDAVRKRCLQIPVEEVVSVDEQMIPFKGHFSVKQYIKNKPKPWGIKIFVLAGKTGFPYDFIVYQGASTNISSFDKVTLGFGAATVLHLIKRLSQPGHQLYFDNYFSTYQLFEILKEKKINATGTVRVNRFNKPSFSSDLIMKKKGRGTSEEMASRDGKIVIVKWQVCVVIIFNILSNNNL